MRYKRKLGASTHEKTHKAVFGSADGHRDARALLGIDAPALLGFLIHPSPKMGGDQEHSDIPV